MTVNAGLFPTEEETGSMKNKQKTNNKNKNKNDQATEYKTGEY